MKYYAAFLRMLDVEKSQTFRPQHLEFLADNRGKGHIFANGRFPDGAGGLVIYKAETLEAATALAKKDPLIVNGARSLDIHEWEIVLAK